MNIDDTDNCAEARDYLAIRLKEIREALADPDKLDELTKDCLFIETHIAINIQLSTGGPGDGFEIMCDARTGQPIQGEHYFITWGFRKEVALSRKQLADVCAAYGIEDGREFLPDRAAR